MSSKRPICYDDIKSNLSMDKATFYRNITKFEDEHIISSFESNDKKDIMKFKIHLMPTLFVVNAQILSVLPKISIFNYQNMK